MFILYNTLPQFMFIYFIFSSLKNFFLLLPKATAGGHGKAIITPQKEQRFLFYILVFSKEKVYFAP